MKQEHKPRKGAPRPAAPHIPGLHQIVRKTELPAFVGLRRTSIDEAIEAGTFPKPIPLGNRSIGWLASELAQWQQQRIAARDEGNVDRSGLTGRPAEQHRRKHAD